MITVLMAACELCRMELKWCIVAIPAEWGILMWLLKYVLMMVMVLMVVTSRRRDCCLVS